jgi:hypothetical protein
MWFALDPELRRQLDNIRQMVALQHQTPKREWPLISISGALRRRSLCKNRGVRHESGDTQ